MLGGASDGPALVTRVGWAGAGHKLVSLSLAAGRAGASHTLQARTLVSGHKLRL